jgi:peptidyl-prolyl cis-trans isomerase A (cyclophilin A)
MKISQFTFLWILLCLVIVATSFGCSSQLGQNRLAGMAGSGTGTGTGTGIGKNGSGETPTSSELQDSEETTATAQDDYHPAMLDPSKANKTAPEKFKVKFATTKGDFIVEIERAWAPNGADRFYNLVDIGYFQEIVIFRAVPRFMFQFGIHGDPKVSAVWRNANIRDDSNAKISNQAGYLCFAHAGPNTRSVQMFINLGNNSRLDKDFTPFGKVIEGMEVVRKINTEYGENAPQVQGNFQSKGNAYILESFPNLDIIKSVSLLED